MKLWGSCSSIERINKAQDEALEEEYCDATDANDVAILTDLKRTNADIVGN